MVTPVRVRRERRLPLPGEVLTRFGAIVEPGDVIARSELVPGNPYIADIARELGIKPEQVQAAMVKHEGEKVRTGDIIARASGKGGTREVKAQADGVIEFVSTAYGHALIREEVKPDQPLTTIDVSKKMQIPPWQVRWYTRVKEEESVKQGSVLASESSGSWAGLVTSPVTGVVEKICPRTGTITIRRPYRPTLIHAYIPGRIIETIPSYGAIVEGSGYAFEGTFGLGGEAYGPCRVVCDHETVFDLPMISADDAGKVLVGGASVTPDAVTAAIAAGVKGIVTGGVDIDTLEGLGVGIKGITGGETLGITLVVMHGFGFQPLIPELLEHARLFKGVCSVSGATQIRAGVKRPEILFCSNDMLPPLKVQDEQEGEPLVVSGVEVRILMGAYQGKPGRVVEVLREPVTLETQERVLLAKVQLANGQVVDVPVRNLKVVL